MIGQHVFLTDSAFVGIVQRRTDDGYVAESIGSHFDGHGPRRILFDDDSPKILSDTWPELRDRIIEVILTDDMKTHIDKDRCTPMVMHLLWCWHNDGGIKSIGNLIKTDMRACG